MELSFEEKKKKDHGAVPAILSNPLDGLDENSLLIQRSKPISTAVGTVVGRTEPDRDSFLSGGTDHAKIVWGNVSRSNDNCFETSNSLRSLEEEKKDNGIMTTVLSVGAAAGLAALAGWGLLNAFGSGSEPEPEPGETNKDKEKMMKAPGRKGHHIPRKDFEDSPCDYFRNLRSKNY